MKTFVVDGREEYPVFSIIEPEPGTQINPNCRRIQLAEAEAADYHRVLAEYDAWQKRLWEACDSRVEP